MISKASGLLMLCFFGGGGWGVSGAEWGGMDYLGVFLNTYIIS